MPSYKSFVHDSCVGTHEARREILLVKIGSFVFFLMEKSLFKKKISGKKNEKSIR